MFEKRVDINPRYMHTSGLPIYLEHEVNLAEKFTNLVKDYLVLPEVVLPTVVSGSALVATLTNMFNTNLPHIMSTESAITFFTGTILAPAAVKLWDETMKVSAGIGLLKLQDMDVREDPYIFDKQPEEPLNSQNLVENSSESIAYRAKILSWTNVVFGTVAAAISVPQIASGDVSVGAVLAASTIPTFITHSRRYDRAVKEEWDIVPKSHMPPPTFDQ